MEGFGAAGQFMEVAIEGFSERIEQTPDVARLELLVAGHPPLVEHQRDQPVGADADIQSTHHEVVGRPLVQIGELVADDPLVLMVPAFHELAHRRLGQAWQIVGMNHMRCRASLPKKCEIVAAKNG